MHVNVLTSLSLRTSVAGTLIICLGCGPRVAETAGSVLSDTVPFQRLPWVDLHIAESGWAVVHDSVKWAWLWHVYGVEGYADDGRVLVKPAPPIDFGRVRVLGISFGATSGCGGPSAFVKRVFEDQREWVVEVDPHDFVDAGPCASMVYPVDFVTVPRSSKPVRLVRAAGADTSVRLPPAADWWIPLSVSAALDIGRTPGERRRHELSLRVLPRDSTLPLADYRRLAKAAYATRDYFTQQKLFQNPRAGGDGDKEVLGWLAAANELSSAYGVPQRFLTTYGLEVASDPTAPRVWLQALMRTLPPAHAVAPTSRFPYSHFALELTRNPGLLADSVLALRLTYTTQSYPEAHASACRAYLARYPRTLVFRRNSIGQPTTFQNANCQ